MVDHERPALSLDALLGPSDDTAASPRGVRRRDTETIAPRALRRHVRHLFRHLPARDTEENTSAPAPMDRTYGVGARLATGARTVLRTVGAPGKEPFGPDEYGAPARGWSRGRVSAWWIPR